MKRKGAIVFLVILIILILVVGFGMIIAKYRGAFFVAGCQIEDLSNGVTKTDIRQHFVRNKTMFYRGVVTEKSREFISRLGVGYNLGNSLDVCDWNSMFKEQYGVETETLWGGAVVSENFIKMVADSGFSTVRVPVTYMNHIDEGGNVDKAWLKRVEEVVNYVIDNEMYCIIDIHHDTGNDGWIKASAQNYSANEDKVKNMIRQIAEHFKDYDEHLILEGFNEMVDEKCHWNKAPYSSLAAYNKWNQLFVDTVRSTGSNNSTRYLLINTYAATYSRINVFFFNMPKDTVDNRLIAGVHNYSEPNNLDKSFKRIEALADKGYPVIIGEFGTIASSDFDRTEHARKYVEMSMERGYCAIWWDNNENPENTPNTSFSLFDRRTNKVYFSNIVEALTEK